MINRREFLRTNTLLTSALALRIAESGATAASAKPLNIGHGPELFLDDHIIESIVGLKREIQRPQRFGPPVLDSKTFGTTQPYLTVLPDDQKGFRMFYNNGPAIWHAESEDGVHWRNPRVAWDRKRGYGCTVVDDAGREKNPARRFKLAHWSSTIDDKPGDNGGIWVGFSPDGFKWSLHDKNPVLWTWPEGWDKPTRHGVGDTVDVYYDQAAQCYRAAVKVHALPEDGYAPGPKARTAIRRLVGMSASKDFVNWEKPWRILAPDREDDGLLEFYGMGGMHLRGDLHIGLVRVLRDDLACDPGGPRDGIGYTALASSRDGVTWHRHREPFLNRNFEPGSWDHAMAWMSQAVLLGDEVFFYYGGYARGHKIEAKRERQVGLARMKKDRYVALTPSDTKGTLLTKPFVVPAGRLAINCDASHGKVGIRLLDADGKPLKALGRPEAENISTDLVAQEVRWPRSIEQLRGKTVRLEFSLQKARFFGFEFITRG